MQLGIIGLPFAGKTTIFELLTETADKVHNPGKTNTGIAKVPDERIDFLTGLFNPKKTVYAQLEILDIPGLVPGAEKAAGIFLDTVRKADALLHVVGLYDDEVENDPIKLIQTVNYELLLADLDLVEKRLERILAGKKKNQEQKEIELLKKLKDCLENERPLATIDLDEDETELLHNYQFLTTKPMLLCLNIAEDHLQNGDYPGRQEVQEYCQAMGIPAVVLSANIEREIAELDGEEKELFMTDLKIDQPGIVKISRSMYERLGLISFFTVGEDEVKAWTIKKDDNAKRAAGKIHTDIERGFIRAEVIDYNHLKELGSISAVKDNGLFRLEGKEYIVKDGDIIHFRFNI